MEVLMWALANKHEHVLPHENAGFASPWLIDHITSKARRFQKAINKDLHRWDEQLKGFVQAPQQTWLKDIHTIYCPMIWEGRHWVGLAIHLLTKFIEVLDPNPDLTHDRKVAGFIEPVAAMLPHILRKLGPQQASQGFDMAPFQWSRPMGLYKNIRSGDCGPLAAKFLEMQANNDPPPHMAGLSDDLVDEFRMHWAMEMYKDFVLPIYFN